MFARKRQRVREQGVEERKKGRKEVEADEEKSGESEWEDSRNSLKLAKCRRSEFRGSL